MIACLLAGGADVNSALEMNGVVGITPLHLVLHRAALSNSKLASDEWGSGIHNSGMQSIAGGSFDLGGSFSASTIGGSGVRSSSAKCWVKAAQTLIQQGEKTMHHSISRYIV